MWTNPIEARKGLDLLCDWLTHKLRITPWLSAQAYGCAILVSRIDAFNSDMQDFAQATQTVDCESIRISTIPISMAFRRWHTEYGPASPNPTAEIDHLDYGQLKDRLGLDMLCDALNPDIVKALRSRFENNRAYMTIMHVLVHLMSLTAHDRIGHVQATEELMQSRELNMPTMGAFSTVLSWKAEVDRIEQALMFHRKRMWDTENDKRDWLYSKFCEQPWWPELARITRNRSMPQHIDKLTAADLWTLAQHTEEAHQSATMVQQPSCSMHPVTLCNTQQDAQDCGEGDSAFGRYGMA
jgi:hypothetical protein